MEYNVIDDVCSRINVSHVATADQERRVYSLSFKDKRGKSVASFDVSPEIYDEKNFPEDQVEKLATLFHNGIWPPAGHVFTSKSELAEFVERSFPDSSPAAKADRLLLFINSFSNFDGQEINLYYRMNEEDRSWRDAQLVGVQEFDFYFEYLNKEGYLKAPLINTGNLGLGNSRYNTNQVALTVKGLDRIIKAKEVLASKTCFVAMSFSGDLKPLYEQAIAPAIRETGFEPLRVDDNASVTSEQTINDAILAAIKKSRFTVADFTEHKEGVYFEAGYALGRGHKVIYTCREDDIDNAHFDTRNYPHILWKNADDLKQQLINKIEVYIKG